MTTETGLRSARRFIKRNQLTTAKNRPRQFIQTPFGNKLLGEGIIQTLADILAGRHEVQPDEPPGFLREPVRELNDPMFLALTALKPLLDGIFRGWNRDDPSVALKLKRKIGDDLYRHLREKVAIPKRWGEKERVQAGGWLLEQALDLDVFNCPEDDFPGISDKWLPKVQELRHWMIKADPAYAPLLKPPPPWRGFEKSYDGHLPATFVRDWRPETRASIEAAFLNPNFAHAAGVNALSRVPLDIDPDMVDLVERFAVKIMEIKSPNRRADQVRADRVTVDADVEDARWCIERGGVIFNDYNCDFRGRVYALGHFNFARADHVRSMFRFALGMKLEGDTYWLEIHCANCEGSTDKESRAERINWVHLNREDITDIARDPAGTFDKWKTAAKPFAYVAACRELAAAWNDPKNFVTRLPIAFDGSANGLQHLSMLIGDVASAALTNLLSDGNDDRPSDAYAALIDKAVEMIEADDCDHARWWREQFEALLQKQKRKLLKQPIMTFAYSVTDYGASDQIDGVYKSFEKAQPAKGACMYLAKKVLETCALELSGPKRVMDYICNITKHCTTQDRFMEWTSPSGFPVSNRYQKLNFITVTCLRGSDRVAQHKVADGVTDEINKNKVLSGAAPNFVHSLDAAHLIGVVNTAISEGIIDLLTVHDCFYCLAPQAARLREIIPEEMGNLYGNNDPLTELRSRNVTDPDILPVPPRGTPIGPMLGEQRIAGIPLDDLIVKTTLHDGIYSTRVSFSPERVKQAKDAFG